MEVACNGDKDEESVSLCVTEREKIGLDFFNKQKQVFNGEFSVFWPRKKQYFWGGVQLQNWLASDHPGAYTSMPQPLFGAKDVCYTEKKVTK